ncbi:hypothetical protein P5V15_000013 [Pogonomyrmex californicus]
MSNPKEVETSVQDTQKTYSESANENSKVNETQNTSLNESQDFRLIDYGGEESMVERARETQDGEDDSQKSIEPSDSQQSPEAQLQIYDNTITVNNKGDEIIIDKGLENEAEKTEEDVSDELCESEKKELFDEDVDIIQGTPPQNYLLSKKVGNIDVPSLKRKAEIIDEPPTKISKIMPAEDMMNVEKQFEEEEEESHQSDDSYQDLFKNKDKNVTIEETQDPTNLGLTQNSLRDSIEHAAETMVDEKTREFSSKQINQDNVDKDKDENLNVSEKLSDTSVNDSTTVVNYSNKSDDSLLEDNNLVTKTRGEIGSTNIVIADEKSGIGTSDEMNASAKDAETISAENNQIEQSNCEEPSGNIVDNKQEISSSQVKLRPSVEFIYENMKRTAGDDENRSKPQVVQIDDDGEKIVLDSSTELSFDRQHIKTKPEVVQIDDSHEGKKIVVDLDDSSKVQTTDKSSYESRSGTDFSYKSAESMKESSLDSKMTMDKRLVNGSTDSKRSDTDATLSLDSDTFSGCDEQIPITTLKDSNIVTHNIKKLSNSKGNSFISKNIDNIELISISDNETSNVEEKIKSDLTHNNLAKTIQVEREMKMYLKFKYVVNIDENTKEIASKELTTVQCHPESMFMMDRQKNDDSQSSLADISDNKESSPGSVNSNPQLYPLNPSRLSTMSSFSSSSASSAASLATRLALKNVHFSIPSLPVKHAKKQDIPTPIEKQMLDETYDRLTREWKNYRLLTTTILNYANVELNSTVPTTISTTIRTASPSSTFVNVSNERLDDPHLEKNMRSSTPSDQITKDSKIELTITPKSTKKGRVLKKPRSKLEKSNVTQSNGENGAGDISNEPSSCISVTETDALASVKKSKLESVENNLLSDINVLANSSPRNMLPDELIGKIAFAKWSDNNYYPGTVIDRQKTKYKVNFFDGKSKTLIPEFVIPIPKILREGLSVYATTKTNGYGSCGIIVNVHTSGNDDTYYTVETDEGERLRVQIQNISLSADQAQVLKEEVDSADKNSLPSTPKALGQVTLDNMVDGKRRSKRIGTPLFSTPKSKTNATGPGTSASKTKSEPSVSGISTKLKKEKDAISENESVSSDSNVEFQSQDWYILKGVQKEIVGTPYEQIVKGPQSKVKSKPRSKKKVEDPQMVETLGPIPLNSNIFKGMSFILTCASLEALDRYQDLSGLTLSGTETETDVETENEDDWDDRPFVRDRLHAQILAGGGKIYENFEKIPKDEYVDTKLITNVPNTTEKYILCLSVGISVCNHKWIIRCCTEGKIVNVAEHVLPTGWSLQKRGYVEKFEMSRSKPLEEIVVIIPSLSYDRQFATFWQQVCENAGAAVLIAEDSEAMETMDFASNIMVVSNCRCPSWAVNRAARQQIPLLSTTWVIQCIIEGRLCPPDQHPRYKYNYIIR